jgi:hypothetical protein
VDVGVAEAGEDAPPTEVDAVRAGQRGLVGADPAGDAAACDRQGAGQWERRLHRPDDAVLQDQARNLCEGSIVWTTMTTLVILLLLVVMLAIASYWPTSD